jgi:hypothetical protein
VEEELLVLAAEVVTELLVVEAEAEAVQYKRLVLVLAAEVATEL